MTGEQVTGEAEGARRRSTLVDQLVRRGTVRTASVEQALRSVPRHAFLPGVDLRTAYADEAVALKWDRGRVLSTISQPTMVASMLEMLDVHRGARVLEIGTGSGYNAALLFEIVGERGLVVTVELDAPLAELAEIRLGAAGYGAVEVHVGDGHVGWPAAAPYDRIIVTASVHCPEPCWAEQLAEGGRMVVPLARELLAVSFDKIGGNVERGRSCPALFIPLR